MIIELFEPQRAVRVRDIGGGLADVPRARVRHVEHVVQRIGNRSFLGRDERAGYIK